MEAVILIIFFFILIAKFIASQGGNVNGPQNKRGDARSIGQRNAPKGTDAEDYFISAQMARSQGNRSAEQFFMLGMYDSLSDQRGGPPEDGGWDGDPGGDEDDWSQ